MSWYEKLVPTRIRTDGRNRHQIPEGLWSKCEECNAVLYRAELERNLQVCPKCGHHMYLGARKRLRSFLDESELAEIGDDIEPMIFCDSRTVKSTGPAGAGPEGQRRERCPDRHARPAQGMPVVAAAFEFEFMAGSMGSVVGERFVRAAQTALHEHIPFICFSASGGPGCRRRSCR